MNNQAASLSSNPLVRQVAAGKVSPELASFLLARELPLTGEEYLEALVFLQYLPEWSEAARREIAAIPGETRTAYLQRKGAALPVVEYLLELALAEEDKAVISAVVLNLGLPEQLLVRVAESAGAEILELLLENQLKLIAFPEIMAAMEANPRLTPYTAGKLREIREFYLDPAAAEPIPEEVLQEIDLPEFPAEPSAESIPDQENQAEVQFQAPDAMTTLQKINSLSISERIKLALTGSKTERMILIKDANKMVSTAVIESPKISVDEVVLLVKNRSIPGEIITRIANNREWTKNYVVVLGLVENPKTPVNRALEYVKKLHIRDLRAVAMDKNVSPVVRGLAMNFFRGKEGGKK